jgi:hypothetical protein
MSIRRTLAALATAAIGIGALTACDDDAVIASENLSKAADNFEVVRRIVFFNGITDTYLLEIAGRCSIDDEGNQLEVVCKTGEDDYKKHFLGLSDNVSYFVEQVEGVDVSTSYYRVTFKPQQIVPDIDFRGEAELPANQD